MSFYTRGRGRGGGQWAGNPGRVPSELWTTSPEFSAPRNPRGSRLLAALESWSPLSASERRVGKSEVHLCEPECAWTHTIVKWWVWVLGITAARTGHAPVALERGGKSQEGPLGPAHLREKGGAGLPALTRIWICFQETFPGSRAAKRPGGCALQSGLQLCRTGPPSPEVELPGLSGQSLGLKPTFCLF